MADETTTEQTVKEPELIKCPCCGEMTLRKPLDIKSIVLDEYMASIISGVPFSHTYTIYDNVDVTVEMPFKRELQTRIMATQKIKALADAAEGDQQVAEKLKAAITMIQLYGDITSIVTKKDGKVNKIYNPAEAVKRFITCLKDIGDNIDILVEEYESTDTPENMSALPDLMLQAIIRTHRELYGVLMETGFNETFWKGIELA